MRQPGRMMSGRWTSRATGGLGMVSGVSLWEFGIFSVATSSVCGRCGGGGLKMFERYGLPVAIRSDNGAPFAAMTGSYGLTRLSAWWRTLGIKLDRIDPGH